MPSTVLLFSKRQDASSKQEAVKLNKYLTENGYRVLDVSGVEERIDQEKLRDVVLGVVLGGDGSFLTLVRRLEEKDLFPLMGVNLGTLGFITQFSVDEAIPTLIKFKKGDYAEELRPLVQVELWRGENCLESGLVLNDAVLNKDARSSMLSMDVLIDGDLLSRTRADGFIVSTPTGSTGYNLSAGGTLLHPEVKAMVLQPLGAHALAIRSVVIPQKMAVEIEIRQVKGPAYLVCDGQAYSDVAIGDKIKVKVAETSLRMIRNPTQTWPNILRSKLGFD